MTSVPDPESVPDPGADSAAVAHDFAARCRGVELLLVDVDGVLTDGVIAIDGHGVETKRFHVRDGSAFDLWRKAGKRAAILSGRSSPAVDHRAAELGIAPVIQGASQKGGPFRQLIASLGLEPAQVCYVGDDLADLPVLQVVGLSVCPADAAPEARRAAHLVTRARGGRGVIREVVEHLLKHQGVWDELLVRYFQTPA